MSSGLEDREPYPAGGRAAIGRRDVLLAAAVGLVTGGPRFAVAASPDRLTWGVHVSLAPTWFEPAEASGIITPFLVLYALHDAMVKPMPDKALAPSLAESFSAAEDGRSYDFVLREGARFHNGDPVTSADVKFSFERYRGVAHDLLQARVEAVETPDARSRRSPDRARLGDTLNMRCPSELLGVCPDKCDRAPVQHACVGRYATWVQHSSDGARRDARHAGPGGRDNEAPGWRNRGVGCWSGSRQRIELLQDCSLPRARVVMP